MEKIDGKITIDLATTAIPRLMTYDNISSFLRCMRDRDKFYIRWLYHLDQYKGLESDWNSELIEAMLVSNKFNDSMLMADRSSRGMGNAVRRLMSEVGKNGVLWIEEDWRWIREFSLSDILKAVEDEGGDSFNFCKVGGRVCGLHPTYWSYKMVRCLLDNWPGDKGFNDVIGKRIMNANGKWKYAHAKYI
ncbi:hypothetical protein LCGC14_2862010, partial [marine sediment metagenome]